MGTNKFLNIALWVAQILLAAFFLMAGYTKARSPVDQLYTAINWTKDVPLWFVRFIGVLELLGSVGLILPSMLRIKPILTPIAASAFITLMSFAIIFHISRGEANIIGMHFGIILVASFVAWGRFRKIPILPKI
jgi:uncharacterized membrane protein YphA (DoxX/SURF4 family)